MKKALVVLSMMSMVIAMVCSCGKSSKESERITPDDEGYKFVGQWMEPKNSNEDFWDEIFFFDVYGNIHKIYAYKYEADGVALNYDPNDVKYIPFGYWKYDNGMGGIKLNSGFTVSSIVDFNEEKIICVNKQGTEFVLERVPEEKNVDLTVIKIDGYFADLDFKDFLVDYNNSSQSLMDSEMDTIIEAEQEENQEEKTDFLRTEYVELSTAFDFSEGLAWVYYTDPESGESIPALLKKDGEVFTTEDIKNIDSVGSSFSGGYSYINTGDAFYIMDINGKIVSQYVEKNIENRIIAGGDGVYLVYQKIESLDENVEKYGIINATGEWLCELSEDSPLGIKYSDAPWVEYYYIGEHNFMAYSAKSSNGRTYSDHVMAFYDAGNDMQYSFSYKQGSLYMTDSSGQVLNKASDGFFPTSKEYYEQSSNSLKRAVDVYVLDDHGFVSYYWDAIQYFRYKNGIIFISDNYDGGTITDGEFYSLDGELMFKYDKYPLYVNDTLGFYEYNDGSAAVIVQGADGNYYIGFIDMNGEFLFEPYKLYKDDYGNLHFSKCSDNAVFARILDEEEGYYKEYIINADGTLVSAPSDFGDQAGYNDDTYFSGVDFHEGYDYDDGYYIGKDGSVIVPYVLVEYNN